MKSHLNEYDAMLESYLGKLASESLETKNRQAEAVRIHYQTTGAGLALPAGQAAATGAFIGAALFAVAALAGWQRPWAWGLIAWLLVQAGAWLWLLRDWRRIVINRLEELTRRDLNNDLEIGSPVNSFMRVELVEDNGHKGTFYDLPGTPQQLTELARGVLAGVPLSRDSWTGPERPFKRQEFTHLQNVMIERKLAYWINPDATARGCKLSKPGRAIFKRLADLPPTTPQGEDDTGID